MALVVFKGEVALESSIVIADYSPRWPRLYAEEKNLILGVIGHKVIDIEHIGSTAVPGLGAKPIIDIMGAVRRLANAEECIELLPGIGYEFAPPEEVGMLERRYFQKRTPQGHSYHLHMVERTSDFWERHLLFRDFLRAQPEIAGQYYQLKQELAARYGADREGYTDAKTSFIESVTALARTRKITNSRG